MRRAMIIACGLVLGAAAPALADHADTDVYTMRVGKGRLGLVVVGITDELKQFYGSGKDGVLIGKVEPGSPAERAGVKVGDVLADVEGKPVDGAADVWKELDGKKKGDPIALTILRNHMPLMLTARLAEDAAPPPVGAMESFFPPAFSPDEDMSQALHAMEQRIDRLEQQMRHAK